MKKLILIALFLCVYSPSVILSADDLGCTLQRPGPFLDTHENKGYTQSLHEDSSEEHFILPSGEVLQVSTYGCQDSWGWEITLTSNKMAEKPQTLKEALSRFQAKVIPFLLKNKDSNGNSAQTEVENIFERLTTNMKKATIKRSASEWSEFLCVMTSTLNPGSKECVIPIDFRITEAKNHFSIVVKYDDLEN